MLGTVLSALSILPHLILTVTLQGYRQCIAEDTGGISE